MQGILVREQASLGHLYDRYQPLLRTVIHQIVLDETDTEETLQDVFLEVWKRAGSYDPNKGKPIGWIIVIARRRAIDRFRRTRRHTMFNNAMHALSMEERGNVWSELCGVLVRHDQSIVDDFRRLLTEMIGTLPMEQQQVISLTYFQGLSQRQIVAHTGIPLGTIKTRLQLALNKLQQRLKPLQGELS